MQLQIYRTKYMDIGVGATISTETRCIESDINRHVLKRKLLVIPLKSLTGCVTLQSRWQKPTESNIYASSASIHISYIKNEQTNALCCFNQSKCLTYKLICDNNINNRVRVYMENAGDLPNISARYFKLRFSCRNHICTLICHIGSVYVW